MLGRLGIKTEQPRRGRRGAEHAEGTGVVKSPIGVLGGDSEPVDDVRADHERSQKIPAARVLFLRDRERGGQHCDIDMHCGALPDRIEVECGRRHAVDEGSRGCRKPPAIHPCGTVSAPAFIH